MSLIKTKNGWVKLGKPIDYTKFEFKGESDLELHEKDVEQRRTISKDLYGDGGNDDILD